MDVFTFATRPRPAATPSSISGDVLNPHLGILLDARTCAVGHVTRPLAPFAAFKAYSLPWALIVKRRSPSIVGVARGPLPTLTLKVIFIRSETPDFHSICGIEADDKTRPSPSENIV